MSEEFSNSGLSFGDPISGETVNGCYLVGCDPACDSNCVHCVVCESCYTIVCQYCYTQWCVCRV